MLPDLLQAIVSSDNTNHSVFSHCCVLIASFRYIFVFLIITDESLLLGGSENGYSKNTGRCLRSKEHWGIRTVGHTFILDFQILVGSRAWVGKHVRSGHNGALGPVVASESKEKSFC